MANGNHQPEYSAAATLVARPPSATSCACPRQRIPGHDLLHGRAPLAAGAHRLIAAIDAFAAVPFIELAHGLRRSGNGVQVPFHVQLPASLRRRAPRHQSRWPALVVFGPRVRGGREPRVPVDDPQVLVSGGRVSVLLSQRSSGRPHRLGASDLVVFGRVEAGQLSHAPSALVLDDVNLCTSLVTVTAAERVRIGYLTPTAVAAAAPAAPPPPPPPPAPPPPGTGAAVAVDDEGPFDDCGLMAEGLLAVVLSPEAREALDEIPGVAPLLDQLAAASTQEARNEAVEELRRRLGVRLRPLGGTRETEGGP